MPLHPFHFETDAVTGDLLLWDRRVPAQPRLIDIFTPEAAQALHAELGAALSKRPAPPLTREQEGRETSARC